MKGKIYGTHYLWRFFYQHVNYLLCSYIIDEEKFGKDAKEAQKAEFERLKRVQEKEQNIRLQSLFSDGNTTYFIIFT